MRWSKGQQSDYVVDRRGRSVGGIGGIAAGGGGLAVIIALVLSLAVVMVTIWGGNSSRARGVILIAAYIGVATMFFIAGDL